MTLWMGHKLSSWGDLLTPLAARQHGGASDLARVMR